MNKLILAATLLTPAAALAGGYFIPNETSRDLGLSEATVADQQGAEAILLNVASLAGLEGLDVSANGELLINQTDWSAPTMGSSSIVVTPTYPPAVAVSYGDRQRNGMRWGLGAGGDVAGGGSLKWPTGWPGQEAAQSTEQQVFQLAAGGAFQPLPYLKLGAAFVSYRVVETLHQSINYLDHSGDAGVALAGNGYGFSAGLELRIPDTPISFGAQYTHSADVSLEGNAHFTAVPTAFQPMIHDQNVSETLTVPNKATVGVAYGVDPDVTVMAAYTFERWTVYKNDTLVGSDGFMVTVPRDYNNAHVLRAGVEWKRTPFLPPLTLRGGLLYNISSQPSDTISPTLTDANTLGVSVGAGYNWNRDLRVDVAYQHAFYEKVTASGDAFPGTYASTADLMSLGLNWRLR